MNKEKYFIDLSKCSEEQRKHIFSLLPTDKITAQIFYMIRNSDWKVLKVFSHLFFNEYSIWQLCSNRSAETYGKTELTYPEFIKLFEGGEGENNEWIKIESEADLPNDNEPMWVMIEDCELPELVQHDRDTDDFYGSDGVIYHSHHITHYMPIVKPEPPKL